MLKSEGKNWIASFRIKLITLYFLKTTFLSLGVGVLIIPIAEYLGGNSFLILAVVFLLVFKVRLIFKRTWKITTIEVANYLNAKFPELEESTTLFLRPQYELSRLEKFQVEKLYNIFPIPNSFKEPLKGLWLTLLFSLICAACSIYFTLITSTTEAISFIGKPITLKESVFPEIIDFNLKIVPPAYTRNPSRSQRQFTIIAEIDAQVIWRFKPNVSVKKLQLIFNDKEIVELNASGQFSKIIKQSGFYQLVLDGKKSDLYSIGVVPDLPVKITIIQPKPHTTIDIGQLPRVNLNVSLSDDYGISDAYISATLSSGKGEGVSFTEKKLTFNADFRNKKEIKLKKLLDLNMLGMKPGDELYFFMNAKDNHGQQSRSDVYLISIVDTANLMSMVGMANGIDLVPEYFRSQRQIIIDTEKLLKEKETIAEDDFKNRSNALGMDQKLLRLRYGKFLGEESETGMGVDHDHEEAAFGDVKALMDEYAHKHDIAEDATFFEPELKKQLKTVLNEMWSSELRLRTYKLQEALPYEYKALRLLKDLQQKSRAYVAKTTLKTTKLKLEKRLTGELDKIIQPTQQATFEPTDRSAEELKLLLSILEQRKAGKSFAYGDRELLRSGEKQLIRVAANQPTLYLSVLKSLRKLSTATGVMRSDIEVVQKAIQQLLGIESTKPQAKAAASEVNLYRSYFNRLKNGI